MWRAFALGLGLVILTAPLVGCPDRGIPENTPPTGSKYNGATAVYSFFGPATSSWQYTADVPASTGTDSGGGADKADAYDPGPFSSEI